MHLAHATWPQVRDYLEAHDGIVIPLGSTEQHGPTGYFGTDSICARVIAESAAESRDDILVAPVMSYAPAQFNLGFAGSISLRSTTLIELVKDVVNSLATGGFRRFYFLNGHGANIAPVRCAIHDLYHAVSTGQGAAGGLDFRLRSWWELPGVDALRQRMFGDREGIHATPSEIAITLAASESRPARGETAFRALDPAEIREHAGDNHQDARRHRAAFPDGCVGSDPAMASKALGEEILAEAARALRSDYLEFTAASSLPSERPPAQ